MKATSPWQYPSTDITNQKKWMLIADPSGSMILKRLFSLEDISGDRNRKVWDCWCEGTKFQHTNSGRIIVVFVSRTYMKSGKAKRSLQYKTVKVTDQLELEFHS